MASSDLEPRLLEYLTIPINLSLRFVKKYDGTLRENVKKKKISSAQFSFTKYFTLVERLVIKMIISITKCK